MLRLQENGTAQGLPISAPSEGRGQLFPGGQEVMEESKARNTEQKPLSVMGGGAQGCWSPSLVFRRAFTQPQDSGFCTGLHGS